MKKLLSLAVAFCLSLGCLTGCGETSNTGNNGGEATAATTTTTVQDEKKGADFKEIYDSVVATMDAKYFEAVTTGALKVASDGSYLSIDTNPTDVKGGNSAMMVAIYVEMLNLVHEKLGISEATSEKLNHVRALDGTQTITDNGIKITYLYHPDQGLQVMYENE